MDDRAKEDIELMVRVRDGDRFAFYRLFRKYEGIMMNYFYSRIWNRNLSRDCNQELFFELWKARKNYRGQGKFTTFLFTIARRTLIKAIRAKQKDSSFFAANVCNSFCGDELADKEFSQRHLPDKKLLRKEAAQKLKEGIALLPEKLRMVVILGELHDFSDEEVAYLLDIAPGTVRTRKHRAIIKLKDILNGLYESTEAGAAL